MRRVRTLALLVLVGLSGCSFERIPSGGDGGDAGDSGDGGDGGDGPPAAMCPSGYGPIHGVGMYRVVNQPELVWAAAAADCNDDDDAPGGPYSGSTHLLVLRDEAERTAITAAGTPIMANTWIGLNDRGPEGTYVWGTSEPTGSYPVVKMPPWAAGDPDDPNGTEDCVRFKMGFTLEDKVCDTTERYVCECDAYPPL